jgi:hypothetical protein
LVASYQKLRIWLIFARVSDAERERRVKDANHFATDEVDSTLSHHLASALWLAIRARRIVRHTSDI